MPTMGPKDTDLLRARFDPRLPAYFMLQVQAALLVSVVTIPLMPVWWLLGRGVHRRQFERLSCELTTRALVVRRGYLLRIQQTIPLDKITDLALYEGPILRYLGLCSLRIETAGGGQAASTGQAMLPGVVDAEAFRDRVLAQRDAVVLDGGGSSLAMHESAQRSSAPAPASGSEAVLIQIRDSLVRIEERLRDSTR
jgi:putative membrane protein